MNIQMTIIDFLRHALMRMHTGTINKIKAQQKEVSPVQFIRMRANIARAIYPQDPSTKQISTSPNPHEIMIRSNAKAKGSPISIPKIPNNILKKFERHSEFAVFQWEGTFLKKRKMKVNRQRINLILFCQFALFDSKDQLILFFNCILYQNSCNHYKHLYQKKSNQQEFSIRNQKICGLRVNSNIQKMNYNNIMAQIQAFQSDKFLTRTLFNNFGKLLVFMFYSEVDAKSVELKTNLETTIPIFGDHENVKYYFISQQTSPDTFKKYEITQTPTVIFTQTDKKVLKRLRTEDVGSIFDALAQEIVVFRERFQNDKAVWHPKIKSILEESQVILFIKGTAENPKCGFTETLLKLFQDHDISFTYYDILADEYMRYWLRNYSGWPTYPQVYSNGKLIGGLDVCKELVAKGEIISRVPKNSRAAVSDRLKEILGQYKHLILTQQFSYKDELTQKSISNVRGQFPNEQIKIYNVSLDYPLSKMLKQTFEKELPLYFIEGTIQQTI